MNAAIMYNGNQKIIIVYKSQEELKDKIDKCIQLYPKATMMLDELKLKVI